VFTVVLSNPAMSSDESMLVQSAIIFSSVEAVPMKDLQLS